MPQLQKGERHAGAGRKPGTPNKSTWKIQEILDRKNANPHEMMVDIMLGNVECNVCRGKLVTLMALPEGAHSKPCKAQMKLNQSEGCVCNGVTERTCESCYGSGYEKISPELRGKVAAELAQYVAPKRKAIEVTGEGGGPVDHRMEIVFIKGKQ